MGRRKAVDKAREFLHAGEYWHGGNSDGDIPQAMVDYTKSELAALRTRLEVVEAANKVMREALEWIPVEERLPEGIPTVLVSWQNVVETGCCINGVWYDYDDNEMIFGKPEAWMPLPEPYIAVTREAIKEGK